MNGLKLTLTIIAITLVGTLPLMAQQKRVSPHETISKDLGEGSRVTVVYGRPFSKDPKTGEVRKIWGGLVPYGKVWRTGSDETTMFITQKPLSFGETTIPAGAYALFTLPEEDGTSKLIISKQIGEWGAYTYDEKQDVARIDLTKGKADAPVDEFTMAIDKDKDKDGGVLKLEWADTEYSAPFTVKK